MARERIDYIIAIAEEKNITRAAERLYVSQPALTQYVNRLEKDYGIVLFDRTKTPIELTETGRFFLEEKIRIEAEEQQLRQKLKDMEAGTIRLTIGCAPSRAPSWIPPVILEFSQMHPDIEYFVLNIGERKLPELLLDHTLDLAVGVFDASDPKFVSTQLTTEPMRLIIPLSLGILPEDFDCSDSFEHPYILKPEELNGQPRILPSQELGFYSSFQMIMESYDIRPGREIVSNNSSSIRKLVLHGMGYSFGGAREDLSDLKDAGGNFLAAYAVLPGLPTTRHARVAYRKKNPHKELLQELSDIVIRQRSDGSC